MDKKEQLKQMLSEGVVSFSYGKKNGEWREAVGTRNPNIIEEKGGCLPKGTGIETPGVVAYWDVDAAGWRSYIEDNILEINKQLWKYQEQ